MATLDLSGFERDPRKRARLALQLKEKEQEIQVLKNGITIANRQMMLIKRRRQVMILISSLMNFLLTLKNIH